MRPLRARYGNKNNGHALLEWEGAPSPLPFSLTSLTDVPPHTIAPGLQWWPSVGCCPIEEWWALWWTMPDTQSRRGGMARSEVALWRREDIGKVDDLVPIMELLAGHAITSMPSDETLAAVAEALLSRDPGPPIFFDMEMWPSIVSTLWKRLWPEARQSFSARVAMIPPQGGELVAPHWLFCTPTEQKLQWGRYRTVVAIPDPSHLGRATKWLLGTEDPTLAEVLNALPTRPQEITPLRMIAVAADQLDCLRRTHAAAQGLDLVRTLIALAPTPNGAAVLKAEGLTALERGINQASVKLILQLANLDISRFADAGRLVDEVLAWIKRTGSSLSRDDAGSLLDHLRPQKAADWWQRAIRMGLSFGFDAPDSSWSKATLRWFAFVDAADIIESLLPANEHLERRLLDVIEEVDMPTSSLHQLRNYAVARQWSRLHAWAAMGTLSPANALRAQRAFPTNSILGLAILVERLPGAPLVDESISSPESAFVELVATRTAREPALLRELDPRNSAWRQLWAAHVRAGGLVWPVGLDPTVLGTALLNAVIAGDEPVGLITATAERLAATALDHPQRASLWNVLSRSGRDALLLHVSQVLVQRCNAGERISKIETGLRDAVLDGARKNRPTPNLVMALLGWGAPVSENELVGWLTASARNGWASNADELGRIVLTRDWKRAAETLYNQSRHVVELRPAVKACESLLHWYQRLLLDGVDNRSGRNRPDSTKLILAVADLGADIAPERLPWLWERAGGARKDLQSEGAPSVRWQEAARLAYDGYIKGGLLALMEQLQQLAPNNNEVREVLSLLKGIR